MEFTQQSYNRHVNDNTGSKQESPWELAKKNNECERTVRRQFKKKVERVGLL